LLTATLVLTMPPMLTTLLVLTSPLLAAIPGRGQTRVITTEQATVGHNQPLVTVRYRGVS